MYIIRKVVSWILVLALFVQDILPARAQAFQPSLLFPSSPEHVCQPPVLKGLKVYPREPLRLDFILDPGTSSDAGGDLKKESGKLIRYFLASLTIPEKDLWVNLSPYENNRIVPEAFGKTEMGRDLLEQDYILKQLTASLLYPEGETGKKFWQKVYALAQEKYGTTDIPVDTFNKVWIVPDKAEVYENVQAGAAYIRQSYLKVMLEQDYLAGDGNLSAAGNKDQGASGSGRSQNDSSLIARAVLREVVIPVLEKEVNEGQHFAALRQVYQSLVLAAWYKRKVKQSLLSAVYVDRNRTAGVDIDDPAAPEKIWLKYLDSFRRGVFDYIKEQTDTLTPEELPRKYFSGGFQGEAVDRAMQILPFDASQIPARGMVVEVAARAWDDAAASAVAIPPFDPDKSFDWQKFFPYIRDIPKGDLGEWYTPEGKEKLRALVAARTLEGRGNTHVFQQSGDEFSPVFELIDNSIDAVFRKEGLDFSLGQFGEGGLQVLSYLREELDERAGQIQGDVISWVTSTPGENGSARRLLFFRRDGKICFVFDRLSGDFRTGTTFTARLSRFRDDADFRRRMEQAVRRKYERNNQIRINCNGDLINPHQEAVYFGAQGRERKYLVEDENQALQLSFFQDGFSVQDHADGMSDAVLLTKLPRPRVGENTPEALARRRAQADIEKSVDGEISRQTTQERMKMVIYAGGRSMVEQDVETGGVVLPENLVLRLPSVTTLTDDKNDIVIDATVESSVHLLTGHFLSRMRGLLSQGYLSSVLVMLGGYSRAMLFLRKRAVAGNGYDFVEDFVSRARRDLLLPYLRQHRSKVALVPASLSESLAGQSMTGADIYYLDDLFFTGSSELPDASFVRSRVFRGQRVYLFPSQNKGLVLPFAKEALLISTAQEESLLQAADRRQAARLMNAVLRENGITGFSLSEEEREQALPDDIAVALATLQGDVSLSAAEKESLRANMQSASVSADALLKAAQALEASSVTVTSGMGGQTTSEGVRISSVRKPDADDLKWRPFRSMHSRGFLGNGNYLWNDSPEFVVTDTNHHERFRSNMIIDWKQRSGGLYRWAINDLPGERNGEYSSYNLLESAFRDPFGLSVNQGRFVMSVPLSKRVSVADSIHLVVSAISLFGAVFLLHTTALWTPVWMILTGLSIVLLRQSFWDTRNDLVVSKAFRLRQVLETVAFFCFSILFLQFFPLQTFFSFLSVFVAIGIVFWWMFIPDYGGLSFLGKFFASSGLEKHVLRLLPSEPVPGFLDINIPGFRDRKHLIIDLLTKGSFVYTSPSGLSPVPAPGGGICIHEAPFPWNIGYVSMVASTGKKVKKTPGIFYPHSTEILRHFSVDDQYVYALTQNRRKKGEWSVYFRKISAGASPFQSFKLRGGLPSGETEISFGRWKNRLYGVAGKKVLGIDLVDGALQELSLPEEGEVVRHIAGPGRYDFILSLGLSMGNYFEYIFDKETQRFYNIWDILPTGEWSSPPVLAEDHVLFAPVIGSDRLNWKRLDFPSLEEAATSDAPVAQDENILSVRRQRFLANLHSLAPQRITDDSLALLPFASFRVLGKLSNDVWLRLLGVVRTSADPDLVFSFFEKMDPVLDTLLPEKLNTVAGAWLEMLSDEASLAGRFLDELSRRHVLQGQSVLGVHLLEPEYFEQAPPVLREVWNGLLYPSGMSVPQKRTFDSLFSGDENIVRSIDQQPWAYLLAARNRADADLDIPALSDQLRSTVPADVKAGYDQEISSAVAGQDPTTLPRELLQNARDAGGPVDVQLYAVSRSDGKYTLVTQVRDKGRGMDDYVMINRLLPLDATSKARHMGQGFYTIWAETSPGDRIVVESIPSDRLAPDGVNGNGFMLSGYKATDGTLMLDSVKEVEAASAVGRGDAYRTLVRQEKTFDSMAELRRHARKVQKRFEYYGSAIEDVDVYFNDQKMNHPGTLAASLRFGHFSSSRLLVTGNPVSRVLQDNLPMPAPLESVVHKYWDGVIPPEVQGLLLSQGVDTEIADGILLTKARTEPAYPSYWPLIRNSESLKAMIALASRSQSIDDPRILAALKTALQEADADETRYPEVKRLSAYLNNMYESDEKQSRFDLVPEEAMLRHWYRLMVRVRFDTKQGARSLLDIYRGRPVGSPVSSEILTPFVLPLQHEDSPARLEARPATGRELFAATMNRFFPPVLRKAVSYAVLGIMLVLTGLGVYPNFETDSMGGQVESSVTQKSEARALYLVTGMRPGEYLIHGFYYSNGNGATRFLRQMLPQGKPTGEKVLITIPVGPHKAGDIIDLPQIVDGVSEEILASTLPLDYFDQTMISYGQLRVAREFSLSGTLTYQIPRRDRNNRLAGAETLQIDPNNQEFQAMSGYPGLQEKFNAISRASGSSFRGRALKVLELTADFIEYDDSKTIAQGNVTATDALMKITEGGKPDRKAAGRCGDISRYYSLFLNRTGYRALDGNVHIYQDYGVVFSNSYHADTYVIGEDGTIVPVPWESRGIVKVRNVSGEYDPPVFDFSKAQQQLTPSAGYGKGSGSSAGTTGGLTEFADKSHQDSVRKYIPADHLSFRATALRIITHPVAFALGGLMALFSFVTGMIYVGASVSARKKQKEVSGNQDEPQPVLGVRQEEQDPLPVQLPDMDRILTFSDEPSGVLQARESVAVPSDLPPRVQEWSRRLFEQAPSFFPALSSGLETAPGPAGMKGKLRVTDKGKVLLSEAYARELDDLIQSMGEPLLLSHPAAWLFLLNVSWQKATGESGQDFLPFSLAQTVQLIEKLPAPGGIDLDPSRLALAISHDDGLVIAIPADILRQYQHISGLVPVIIAVNADRNIRALFSP